MSKVQSIIGILVALLFGGLVTLAGVQQGSTYLGYPVFAICALLAFTIQWCAFIPAYLNRTEIYYDLVGGITYILVICLALTVHIRTTHVVDNRTLLIATICGLWALRLGSFLFRRILKAGFDSRFIKIKQDPLQFLMTWTMQGLWVIFTLAAGLAAMTSDHHLPLGWFGLIGAGIWLLGFSIEIIADRQKSEFRKNNKGFITTGLWSWSRHPNYFGEILLWLGIAIIAFPVLEGWRLFTLISPVFVFVLLVFVSGVRMLENSGMARWGEDDAYLSYVDRTSVLVPLPPKQPSLDGSSK